MRIPVKPMLMLLPLILAAVVLGFVVNDIRHPVIERDTCTLIGIGTDAQKTAPNASWLYRNGENALNDLAFTCRRWGAVLANDHDANTFPLAKGRQAEITRKSYEFIPDVWHMGIVNTKAPAKS